MAITKTDLQHETKFTWKNNPNHVFTYRSYSGGSSVSVDILLNVAMEKAVSGNHYNVQSITDKYLTIWDIQFGKKSNYKVALEDLTITDVEYKII
jgi:2-oxoglutarate dehydrogenase complex dehydrogenase (E1) component-like enzyme